MLAGAVHATEWVGIYSWGLYPGSVTSRGDVVQFENYTADTHRIVSDEGLFDSGPLGPRASFSMRLQLPGAHPYHSTGPGGFTGVINVPRATLDGPSGEPALAHIPDLPFPEESDDDRGIDPRLGVGASATRILLMFAATTTVAEANEILQDNQLEIIGGIPSFKLLLVKVDGSFGGEDFFSENALSGNVPWWAFSNLHYALDSLRDDDRVLAAAEDTDIETKSIPRPPASFNVHFSNENAVPKDQTRASNWVWGDRTNALQPLWSGDNWWLEADRAPQAWNLLDAIKAKRSSIDVAVVDAGFKAAHPDLPMTLERLCTAVRCTSQRTDDHGTHTAGTIGAAYDNPDPPVGNARTGTSVGVSGIDSALDAAHLHAVSWGFDEITPGTAADGVEVFRMVLNEVRVGGRMPRLKVISYSGGPTPPDDTDLQAIHASSNCGPLDNDDGAVGSNQSCSMENDDAWLTQIEAQGAVARVVAENASDLGVMIVQAAGNESNDFCVPLSASTPCTFAPIQAQHSGEFAWASSHWSSVKTNPILVVEGVGTQDDAYTGLDTAGLGRSTFSNYGGDISAPATNIVSTVDPQPYGVENGTSMATPQVSGAIGYLYAYDPNLTIAQVKAALIDNAVWDVTAHATQSPGIFPSPRLDLFASLLSLRDAAKTLVDVNDKSKDGSQRVERHGDSTPNVTLPYLPIAPDKKIDMRDFRAFRDAWLQACLYTQSAGCPQPGEIALDGPINHPKKDTNLDACVQMIGGLDLTCPTDESIYSRFDFNGDGVLDSSPAQVPLDHNGAPDPLVGTSMTDLAVLRTFWDTSVDNTEGYGPSRLSGLLESGDLEIHANDLLDRGAGEVKLTFKADDGTVVPTRTLKNSGDRNKDFVVASVPAFTKVTVQGSATIDGKTVDSAKYETQLLAGDDERIDLCQRLSLVAAPARIPADGSARTKVTAKLRKCADTDTVAAMPITFEVDKTSVSFTQTPSHTDANGQAVAVITAGTTVDKYKVTATVDMGNGQTEIATTTLETTPKLTITYQWKQTIDNWSEDGSTRWTGAPPTMPDCTMAAGVDYCLDGFHIELGTQQGDGLQRFGTLLGGGSDFKLTEQVQNSRGTSNASWTLAKPDGTTEHGAKTATWQVLDPNAYVDHVVDGVTTDDATDGLHVSGLQTVGDLPYHYGLFGGLTDGHVDPVELHAVQTDMLLVPQGGEPIRFAADPAKEVLFTRNPDGTLAAFQSCAAKDVDLTSTFGYRIAGDAGSYLPGAISVGRKTDYVPGDRPMPVGPGHEHISYSFAATATYGNGAVVTPTLPDCSINHPPVAKFEGPATADEGHQTHWVDRSTDIENDIVSYDWNFGDGEPHGSGAAPFHMFPDNGVYSVTLTVKDSKGLTNSTSHSITVSNVDPEGHIDDATAQVGTSLVVHWGMVDLGKVDKTQLTWSITSPTPPWPAQQGQGAATESDLTLGGLPAGVYPLVLKVTDKDGGTVSVEATATVTANPVPVCDPATGIGCPPPPPPVFIVCDPTITLDAEETNFLNLVNAYRIQMGVAPLVGVSPTLSKAAEEHAHDMAIHDYMAHVGLDGRNPGERAWDAGYPATATVGENLATDTSTGAQAFFAWRSSTAGHNENMLDPRWKAIGISRELGNHWRWATSYGNVLDCPVPAPPGNGLLSFRAGSAKHASGSGELSHPLAKAKAKPTGRGVRVTHRAVRVQPHAKKQQVKKQQVHKQRAKAHKASKPHKLSKPHKTQRAKLAQAKRAALARAHPVRAKHPAKHSARLLAFSSAAATVGPPIPALTISDYQPTATKPVTFTNRSRDAAGTPIAAELDFGDGSAPAALGPDESVVHRFANEQYVNVLLTASAGGATLDVDKGMYINALPAPYLAYQGDHQGFSGKTIAVGAIARTWAGGDPIPNLPISFTLSGQTVTGTTGADGVAHAVLDLTGVAQGSYSVIVRFAGSDDYAAVNASGSFSVLTNHVPTADAGGPYLTGLGNPLLLDASLSSDPDQGDSVRSYHWDLTGDGVFDDASGPTPVVPWERVSATLCVPACVADHDYTVAVRVTDTRDDSATATAHVRFTEDFAILLGSENKTVVPGASNSFAITIVGSDGFSSPVTLTTEGLPDGVTGSFSVNPVPPGTVSVLTLSAGASAQIGTFPVIVSGTANGITHQVSDEVKVAFGLIPVCYGQVTGIVTDEETGAPVKNVGIQLDYYWYGQYASTDESGRFVFRNVPLGNNNAPSSHIIQSIEGDYWPSTVYVTAACGGVATTSFTVLKKKQGQLSGSVVEGVVDSDGQVHPTDTPIPGAAVYQPYYNNPYFVTAADGTYGGPAGLFQGNTDRGYSITAEKGGYWPQQKGVTISATTPATLDFALVKQCTATLGGGHVLIMQADGTKTEQPSPFHNVTIYAYPYNYNVTTDAQGNFSINQSILMGYNNQPVAYYAVPQPNSTDPPGSYGVGDYMNLSECGATSPPVTLYVRVIPRTEGFGNADGYVTDRDTGAPIEGATVGGAVTDATGYYHIDHIFLGFNTTTGGTYLSASKDEYYAAGSVFVSLTDGETSHQDFTILRKRYGAITGVVRDIATDLPIQSALVSDANCYYYGRFCAQTDRTGTYAQGHLALNDGNASPFFNATATAEGYWPITKYTHVDADQTTTLDFNLLRKCQPARITGSVINAVTGNPIQSAQVTGGLYPVYTDAQGHFEIVNLQPGFGNSPAQVYMTASASGFFSQSRIVTIFCGAQLTIDFGTRQSNLGTIVGTVTDTDTGLPMPNVFVGGAFGGTTTTDDAGNYRFAGVPLGDNNSDKDWDLSASPQGYRTQHVTVTAKANVEVRADFSFSRTGDRAPVAQDRSATTTEDHSVPITVAATDEDGDALVYSITSYPEHGRLNGGGPDYTYYPDTNYNGPDSFQYVANDGERSSVPATVTLTVTPVSDPPSAVTDQVTTQQGTPVSIPVATLLANDSDPDGDSVSFVDASANYSTYGTVTVHGGETVLYSPQASFYGSAFFNYRITDGNGNISTGYVQVVAEQAVGPPVCADLVLQAGTYTPLDSRFDCVDAEGDSLSYTVVSGPAHGTLAVGLGGSFTYTPADAFEGIDTFTYKANDGTSDSRVATATITVVPVSHPPVPVNDTYTIDEGTTLTAPAPGVLANDFDRDGDVMTAFLWSYPQHGYLTLRTNGSFDYVPYSRYFTGTDTFRYYVLDGSMGSQPATVTINVTPVNMPPLTWFDEYNAAEDTALVAAPWQGVLANDWDPEGQPLAATIVASPEHGTLDFAADGSFTYHPEANYSGEDSFSYTASDGALVSEETWVFIDVASINDPPIAGIDSYSTLEDTSLVTGAPGVLINDSDPEGAPVTAVLLTRPAHGQLTLAANGSFLYVPSPDYNGPDRFRYRASDGTGGSPAISVALDVIPVNDAPVGHPDAYAIAGGNLLTVTGTGVLGNDTDVEGDALTATLVQQPAHGALTLHEDGSFTYLADSDFNGVDHFTYRASDGALSSDPVTVSLTVTTADLPPLAQSAALTTPEDTPLAVSLVATDPEGGSVTFSIVDGPFHGRLTGTAPNLTYTPDPNYNGLDAFSFTASDGAHSSEIATVSIVVQPVNDAPVGTLDGYSTPEDSTLTVPAPGVLGNDTDVDGDSLSAVVVLPAAHGTVDLNADGSFTYLADANFNGTDGFAYRASDGLLDTGLVNVVLTVQPVNDAPVAVPQSIATDEDTAAGVTLTASDIDSAVTGFRVVTGPSHGALSGTDANLTYTPDLNFNGPDSFTYVATDGLLDSAPAVVTIDVRPVNDPPLAADQSVWTPEDTALPVVLGGSDVDGDALSFGVVSLPAHGVLSGSGAGLTYTPNANYNGPDSFGFRASDGVLGSNVATVSIEVRPVNDAPVANDQSVITPEDTAVPVQLGGSDVEGDPLSFATVRLPAHGTLSGSGRDLTYTPAADFNGSDSFTFGASDGSLSSAPATVTITVTPVNDAPVAADQSLTTDQDVAVPVTLAASDVDSGSLSYSVVGGPAHGRLSGVAPNLTYTPDAGYGGSDLFTFRASDGALDSNLATINILVRHVNHRPTALDRAVQTQTGTAVNVLLGGSDPDGDALSFGVDSAPEHGSLSGAPPLLTYTPEAGFIGHDSFRYHSSDGVLQSEPATVSIDVVAVQPTNRTPTVGLAPAGPVDEGSFVMLAATASDPDGDPLAYSWSSDVGTVAGAGAGARLDVDDGPAAAHVLVLVTDTHGASASATVTVDVRNVAPTATASAAPAPQFWGIPVHFAGSATDPSHADSAAGLIPTWNYGDGVLSANPAGDHAFAQAGSYAASFSARDKDGGLGSFNLQVGITKRPSAVAFTGIKTDGGASVTLSAKFTDPVDIASARLAGHPITFDLNGALFTALTDAAGVATVPGSYGVAPGTVTVTFPGDADYGSSSAVAPVGPPIDFGSTAGFFAVGPSAVLGSNVTFWGSQWPTKNLPSAPSSFKGFVSTSALPPKCGTAWLSRPGNSGNPPATIPGYLAVVVTSQVAKNGSALSGPTTHIAIVKTNAGYGAAPGQDGTGKVVAIIC